MVGFKGAIPALGDGGLLGSGDPFIVTYDVSADPVNGDPGGDLTAAVPDVDGLVGEPLTPEVTIEPDLGPIAGGGNPTSIVPQLDGLGDGLTPEVTLEPDLGPLAGSGDPTGIVPQLDDGLLGEGLTPDVTLEPDLGPIAGVPDLAGGDLVASLVGIIGSGAASGVELTGVLDPIVQTISGVAPQVAGIVEDLGTTIESPLDLSIG